MEVYELCHGPGCDSHMSGVGIRLSVQRGGNAGRSDATDTAETQEMSRLNYAHRGLTSKRTVNMIRPHVFRRYIRRCLYTPAQMFFRRARNVT
jgi:hypothetical protein